MGGRSKNLDGGTNCCVYAEYLFDRDRVRSDLQDAPYLLVYVEYSAS